MRSITSPVRPQVSATPPIAADPRQPTTGYPKIQSATAGQAESLRPWSPGTAGRAGPIAGPTPNRPIGAAANRVRGTTARTQNTPFGAALTTCRQTVAGAQIGGSGAPEPMSRWQGRATFGDRLVTDAQPGITVCGCGRDDRRQAPRSARMNDRAGGRVCDDLCMDQRISLVTLGVTDLARARSFYEALGWGDARQPDDEVCFFQAGGMVFGLWTALAACGSCGVGRHVRRIRRSRRLCVGGRAQSRLDTRGGRDRPDLAAERPLYTAAGPSGRARAPTCPCTVRYTDPRRKRAWRMLRHQIRERGGACRSGTAAATRLHHA